MGARFSVCLLLGIAGVLHAQDSTGAPVHPWAQRPRCAPTFLNSDWTLDRKQRVCNWLANGVFSPGGLLGAGFLSATSTLADYREEGGDSYLERFGRRAFENGFKSSGSFLGAWIAGEDPRRRPPYLALRGRRPTGVFARSGLALKENLLAYRCIQDCHHPEDVRAYLSVGRILGAAASGYGREFTLSGEQFSPSRALRSSASAYGIGFVNALMGEFTPELTSGAAKAVSAIFRGL